MEINWRTQRSVRWSILPVDEVLTLRLRRDHSGLGRVGREVGLLKVSRGATKDWLASQYGSGSFLTRVGIFGETQKELIFDSRGNQTLQLDESTSSGRAGVDFYFIQDDGDMFKSTICYEPYFYLACRVSFWKV